jgi:ABC-type lipoprotein export system ATPase subunit
MQLMLEMIDDQNSTLCLITHDESLASDVADRVIRLRDGKLVSP